MNKKYFPILLILLTGCTLESNIVSDQINNYKEAELKRENQCKTLEIKIDSVNAHREFNNLIIKELSIKGVLTNADSLKTILIENEKMKREANSMSNELIKIDKTYLDQFIIAWNKQATDK